MKLLTIAFQLLASLFSLFPLQHRIVFLSRQSSKLSLDYKLLIEELERSLSSKQIVVKVTNPETKTSFFTFAKNTLNQLYYARTSKVVIVDGYIPAVSIPKKDKRITVIQLWHSLGAIKKFGYQSLDTPAGRTRKDAEAAHMHENYDFIIAGGPGAISTYSEAFSYPEDKVLPLGLPRIDYLLDPNPQSKRRNKVAFLKRHNSFLLNGNKNILYAPTLRKGAGYENWLTEALYALSEKYDKTYHSTYNLIIAGHPLDLGFDKNLLKQYPQLHFIPGASTIDLLEIADEVVSDYSAIIFEAGLLNKQLSYYVPDFEQYSQSPGLNIDPRRITSSFVQNYLGHPHYGVTAKLAHFVLEKLA